jgi:hypothetical protein
LPPPEDNEEGEQPIGVGAPVRAEPPTQTKGATAVGVNAKLGDVDVMEIVMRAWGANEDTGAIGACTGTLWAKSGHFFKNDQTASRFNSLFADFGDYDGFTTPCGSIHGMCPTANVAEPDASSYRHWVKRNFFLNVYNYATSANNIGRRCK